MSDILLDMKNAFEIALSGATIRHIDTTTDIAWPNFDFDPTNKSAWLAFNFTNVDTLTDTKDTTGVVDTGFIQIDVFVPLNDVESGVVQYDNKLMQIAGDVRAAFPLNSRLSYNTANLTIDSISSASELISESWMQLPLTINYVRI